MSPDELADLKRLRQARDLIDRCYDEPLDVAALAATAKMSPGHFSRRFREAYGEAPYAYLSTRRIERAMLLLRIDDLTVTDVCMAVGFTSLGSFSSRFADLVGESPSAYRTRDHSGSARLPGCVAKVVTRPLRRERQSVRNGEAGPAAAS